MDKSTIEALEIALEATPENLLLRRQIADGYFNINEFEKAKNHYTILLQQSPDKDTKLALIKCYQKLGNFSTGLIIAEEMLTEDRSSEMMVIYIQLLIDDGQNSEAIEQYKAFQMQHEEWYNENLEYQLKIDSSGNPHGLEGEIGGEAYDPFLEKPSIDFSHVGGMDQVKDEIKMKIIHPLQNPDLYKAYGKKAGGGILMYGPPGCGKTYLSKATAGEIQSKFLTVGIEDTVDMWMGNSEKNLHAKFEIARGNSPCVMFFDEIDALGSKRNDLKQSAGRNIINQFLKEMDGIDSNNDGLLILGATNSPWHMDSAFLRPGRFDRIIFVPPPDQEAREKILKLMLADKPVEKIDYGKIASKTNEFSGADISALIDLTIEEKLRSSMKTGKIEPIRTKEIITQIKRVRPSTKDWFNTARNYALYSNNSGIYDDIVDYLKL